MANVDVESIWCVVMVGGESVLVGCVYRPGDAGQGVSDLIDLEISRAKKLIDSKKFTGLLIAGDFNYWEIDWPDCNHIPLGSAHNFKDTLDDNYIIQNVNVKTFQTGDGSPSNILDLVLTDSSDRIPTIEVGPPLGNINKAHMVLKWKFYLRNKVGVEKGENPFKETKKRFNKGDYTSMNEYLLGINWNESFLNKSVEECYNEFLGIYGNACNVYIPNKNLNINRKDKPKWLTNELRVCLREKRSLWFYNNKTKWQDDIIETKI